MRLVAFCLSLLPLPALACVTPEDVARGVSFTRSNGLNGELTVEGNETVINYDIGREGATDDRRATFGVFETRRVFQENVGILVGSAIPVETWKHLKKPVPVQAGGSWTGRLRGQREDVGYGTEMKEYRSYVRWGSDATYAFLPEQEVTLSKCNYIVIPVEATFSGDIRQTQRWLYFRDLGFAIETIRDGKKTGLRDLSAK